MYTAYSIVTDHKLRLIRVSANAQATFGLHKATTKRSFNIQCPWREPEIGETSHHKSSVNFDSKPHLFIWIDQEGDERPRKSDAIHSQKLLSQLVDQIMDLQLKYAYLEKRELAAMSFGVFVTFDSIPETIRFAEKAASLNISDINGLKLICDYGIVQRREGKALENDVRALIASKDIKELPMNHICTTERFATQARVMAAKYVGLHRIGLVSVNNPLPSMSFYRARSKTF